jgi:hypothetical protein
MIIGIRCLPIVLSLLSGVGARNSGEMHYMRQSDRQGYTLPDSLQTSTVTASDKCNTRRIHSASRRMDRATGNVNTDSSSSTCSSETLSMRSRSADKCKILSQMRQKDSVNSQRYH